MNIEKRIYKKFVKGRAPRSPLGSDCLKAFLVGGAVCTVSQLLRSGYALWLGYNSKDAGTAASITLVFLAALFTGAGIFDNIAKFSGAGTLVPITGFANAVVSCAIDSRSEGFVLGVGANMFKIAGPVIVYGTVAGTLYGMLYWFFCVL